MKKMLIKLLGLIIKPVKHKPRFFLPLKDIMFQNAAEPFYRAIEFIRKTNLLKNGDCIVDIGAADGRTAYRLAKAFPSAKVIGFEPNLTAENEIRKNTGGIPSIEIRMKALGREPGKMTLHVTQSSFSSSLLKPTVETANEDYQEKLKVVNQFDIDVSTLDREFAGSPPIVLMKLDTQGTELSVLGGGKETLKKTKLILIEMSNHDFYQGGCKYYEVDEFLRSTGFELLDMVITYRANGKVDEYDAIYRRKA